MMPMSFNDYFWILGLSAVWCLIYIAIDKYGKDR